ncbi:MAG: aminodeoxychorismate/anthranilate synthase component II [Planctomycetota bacterium]
MIALVDNRDSFTFNLVQQLQALGAEVRVLQGRTAWAADALDAAGVVLGPGPGTPAGAGCCEEVVRRAVAAPEAPPILGVCLGHQAIATALGGRVRRSADIAHGRTRAVRHDGSGLLRGLPSPFEMARYNSLVVDEAALPDGLVVTGRTEDGDVAALRHVDRPIHGVQGHPESVLCVEGGRTVLANFLRLCGVGG